MNLNDKIEELLEEIPYKTENNDLYFQNIINLINKNENDFTPSIKKLTNIITQLLDYSESKKSLELLYIIFETDIFKENKLCILSNIDYFFYTLNNYEGKKYFSLLNLLLKTTDKELDIPLIFKDKNLNEIIFDSLVCINKKEPFLILPLLENKNFIYLAKYYNNNILNYLKNNNELYQMKNNLKNF